MPSQYSQRFGVVLTALQKMVRRGGKSHIQKIVSKLHSADVAKLLRHFDPDEQWLIFGVIDDPEFAAEILSEADADTAEWGAAEGLVASAPGAGPEGALALPRAGAHSAENPSAGTAALFPYEVRGLVQDDSAGFQTGRALVG